MLRKLGLSRKNWIHSISGFLRAAFSQNAAQQGCFSSLQKWEFVRSKYQQEIFALRPSREEKCQILLGATRSRSEEKNQLIELCQGAVKIDHLPNCRSVPAAEDINRAHQDI